MKNKVVSARTAYEMRYEERGDQFKLDSWPIANYDAAIRHREHGTLDERQEWLVNIVNMAKLAGRLARIPYPPPDALVWFTVDANCNLLEFMEFDHSVGSPFTNYSFSNAQVTTPTK